MITVATGPTPPRPAHASGSLAFFAPEGVGVKDGALVALLAHATGLPMTTCMAAALAVRALDPVTKLSLLGVLALRADVVMARLLRGAATWPRRGGLSVRLQVGLVARGRRGLVLLGAGMLAPVLVLSSYSAWSMPSRTSALVALRCVLHSCLSPRTTVCRPQTSAAAEAPPTSTLP